jgi:5-methylcytosine-specific restriction endonuclease McrA
MAEADPKIVGPMNSYIEKIVAAHPIDKKPYHCIRFVEIDQHGSPLYSVTGVEGVTGAYKALQRAFEKHGGHCFHCDKWMDPQPMSHNVTRDHIHPKSAGGSDYLHNLVLAHGHCNRAKGASNLAQFSVERGDRYLKLLDQHITKIIQTLAEQTR